MINQLAVSTKGASSRFQILFLHRQVMDEDQADA